ncbi:hypothetical protein Catovirus_1_503 [Catovirus CTV1]|uniref:Uncharacterized protein n=1 Tax=Catovirus CTV1 TaxID=1977631 RepID=A0A1V0S9T3_9VIRU|nr:hypothetical protein Catovirus_1_503 [Catovirus CTV1]
MRINEKYRVFPENITDFFPKCGRVYSVTTEHENSITIRCENYIIVVYACGKDHSFSYFSQCDTINNIVGKTITDISVNPKYIEYIAKKFDHKKTYSMKITTKDNCIVDLLLINQCDEDYVSGYISVEFYNYENIKNKKQNKIAKK